MSLRDPASLPQNPMFRHGSLAPRFLLAVSLGAVLASSANAGGVIYDTSMTASGTIGATAFSGKTVDILMTGDTANVAVFAGSSYQNTFNHVGDGISFTIFGAGAGGSDITGNITSEMMVISTGSTYWFDGPAGPGYSNKYTDLWYCERSGTALTAQQALTTTGLDYPVAKTEVLSRWSLYTTLTTTAGNLTLNPMIGTAHFSTGSAAIPEPSQYAMMAGLGLVGFGVWRKKTKTSK